MESQETQSRQAGRRAVDWEGVLGVPNPSSPMVYDVYRAGNGPVPHDVMGMGSAMQCPCQQRLPCVICRDAGTLQGASTEGTGLRAKSEEILALLPKNSED